jgi:hypothetical protein
MSIEKRSEIAITTKNSHLRPKALIVLGIKRAQFKPLMSDNTFFNQKASSG